MGQKTGIAWTDHTFNPWWGCEKISPGCAHCYAATFSERQKLKIWGKDAPRRTFDERHWNQPLVWNRAAMRAYARRRVFCASMADVFEDHPIADQERPKLFTMIMQTPWLDWQLLTKRPENFFKFVPRDWRWPKNVWPMTTVENQAQADIRIEQLLKVDAEIHGLSCEPLLGPLNLQKWLRPFPNCGHVGRDGCCEHPNNMTPECHSGDVCPMTEHSRGINWVIIGGETGAGARPFQLWWAREIIAQCRAAGVAVFVKQLGAKPLDVNFVITLNDKRAGANPDEWPADLRVREFPEVK